MNKIILSLAILFVLELLVLIKIGSAIGGFATITLMFAFMVLGVILVKLRFRQIIEQMRGGGRVDLGLIWLPLSGFLFIFPGFISDILALLLMIPQLRSLIGRKFAQSRRGFGESSFFYYEQDGKGPFHSEKKGGRIIDVEPQRHQDDKSLK